MPRNGESRSRASVGGSSLALRRPTTLSPSCDHGSVPEFDHGAPPLWSAEGGAGVPRDGAGHSGAASERSRSQVEGGNSVFSCVCARWWPHEHTHTIEAMWWADFICAGTTLCAPYLRYSPHNRRDVRKFLGFDSCAVVPHRGKNPHTRSSSSQGMAPAFCSVAPGLCACAAPWSPNSGTAPVENEMRHVRSCGPMPVHGRTRAVKDMIELCVRAALCPCTAAQLLLPQINNASCSPETL